jgi:nitrogen fixation protein FixH
MIRDMFSHGRGAPWLIVVFFAVQIVLFVWFVMLATDSNHGLVTEQAYEKGLAYNQTLAAARAQEKTGFSLAIAHEQDLLKIAVRRAGAPVAGADVAVWFYRPTDSHFDVRGRANESANGLYTLSTVHLPRGLWEARVTVTAPGGAYQSQHRFVR